MPSGKLCALIVVVVITQIAICDKKNLIDCVPQALTLICINMYECPKLKSVVLNNTMSFLILIISDS